MLTEKDLLLDVIQNTPEFSAWTIFEDSWEKFPKFSVHMLQWVMNMGGT
ncbi:hypothetical protein QE390_004276 [Siphonobacter sp. SORGH_AS 1065]|nr:hypothetical protein [Siphonobacter sp. SORGH_AS_1065]